MTGRSDARPLAIMVGIAVLFAAVLYGAVSGGRLGGLSPAATASPAPSAARGPVVKIVHDTCCKQTARYLNASWESSERVTNATFSLTPAPPFDCSASIDPSGLTGHFGCAGLLQGATSFIGRLALTTLSGTFPFDRPFRTMGDRLDDVKWFTEFEDPTAEPLACAAASIRIIQNYTTGEDKLTATQILQLGQQLNKSADPGTDPAGIAAVLHRLSDQNNYHYYRYDTRDDATGAAVYWLVRSGKPVIVLTLGGQHAPVVTGFQGAYGTYYDDPANKIAGVIVEDPQRGDLRPETLSHRPDKPRAADYQTGHLVPLKEWTSDEWWLGFAYQPTIKLSNGTTLNIERNDKAYPTPHWAGKFVVIADDGDSTWPSDKEGRVKFR